QKPQKDSGERFLQRRRAKGRSDCEAVLLLPRYQEKSPKIENFFSAWTLPPPGPFRFRDLSSTYCLKRIQRSNSLRLPLKSRLRFLRSFPDWVTTVRLILGSSAGFGTSALAGSKSMAVHRQFCLFFIMSIS